MKRLAGICAGLLLPAFGAAAAPADLTIPKVDPSESILSEYVSEAAPDPNPPPYTLLRYNERYDYLADPKNRRDFFDPVKYIPLGSTDPQSYLSLGGELRERYENLHNAGFGVAPEHNASYLLQRITLAADLHVSQRLRLFAQGISGLQFGQQETAPPVNQNPLDLQQGFVDYILGHPTVEGPRLTTRFGRFEMTYGSGRLVATRAAPNIPFKFDGVQLIGGMGSSRVYAFAVHPGLEQKYRLDTENGGQAFWGVYSTTPLGWRLPANLDLYYLGARYANARYAAGTGTELRHTIGTRSFGKAGGWDYDWEPVVQFGKFASREILAWTLATDTGYSFKSTPWQPRIGFKADIASGDSGRPNGQFGSFNPLYFKSGYFNDVSIIRPTNIADLHPSLQFVPVKPVTATLATDLLWRYSVKDGVYAPPGNIELRPASGAARDSRYIGNTAETAVEWKACRHIAWTASYVHLFASDAVHAAGGHDVDYFGSWVTFTW
ncbi:MAG TPA: alginate export family protein [Nevskia sp.]|nr:alginate export family protein [Nevskia sp.]